MYYINNVYYRINAAVQAVVTRCAGVKTKQSDRAVSCNSATAPSVALPRAAELLRPDKNKKCDGVVNSVVVRPSTGTRQVAAGGDRAAAPRRDRHTRTQPRLAQSAEHSPGDHLWAGRGGAGGGVTPTVTTPLVRRGQGPVSSTVRERVAGRL